MFIAPLYIHDLSPVAISIFGINLRWYALAYIAGILLGSYVVKANIRRYKIDIEIRQVEAFITYAILGILLGGRLGYVFFYAPLYHLQNPLQILMVWQGGMSFHGGLLGAVMANILFCHRHRISFWQFGDLLCMVAPLGFFLGRIANFINGELWGKPATSISWAVVFPMHDYLPRHPSQLYEALLEGLLLFILLRILFSFSYVRVKTGLLCGTMILGYGLARSFCELYRVPDYTVSVFGQDITSGQLLSIPLMLAGLGIIIYSIRRERGDAPRDASRDLASS